MADDQTLTDPCDSLWAVLWAGHDVEIAEVRSPRPVAVSCTDCGKKLTRKRVKAWHCLKCDTAGPATNLCKGCEAC